MGTVIDFYTKKPQLPFNFYGTFWTVSDRGECKVTKRSGWQMVEGGEVGHWTNKACTNKRYFKKGYYFFTEAEAQAKSGELRKERMAK